MPVYLLVNRLAILFWVSVCVVLGYVDLSFITQNINIDSDRIMELRSGVGEAGNSFANTAIIFGYIPDILLIPVVLLISSVALIIFMKDMRRVSTILIAMYITLPAVILFLPRPQKETIVVIMTIIVYWIFKSKYSQWIKLALFTAIYIAYAIFMRQYYFLIVAAFFGLHFGEKMAGLPRLAAVIATIAILMMLPEKFFTATQGVRDVVNHYLGSDGQMARTAFLNPLPADNGLNFVLNYIYSAIRLNFPILFTFGYKEILHMISVFIIGRFIWMGLGAKNNPDIILCSQLAFAHVLVLLLFEPDVGTYLRHLTSVFLYLTPMLLLADTNNNRRIRFVT
jgi:hypothetical protein